MFIQFKKITSLMSINISHFNENLVFRLFVLYSIVLYCIEGVVIAAQMHCDLFRIYCASPNLGITRTWICRLNFAHRPIFQAWGSLTSLEPQTRDPPGGLVLRSFTSWKNPLTSAGFEPANLWSRGEHETTEAVYISSRWVIICSLSWFYSLSRRMRLIGLRN